MGEMEAMYRELGISSQVLAYGAKIEKELKAALTKLIKLRSTTSLRYSMPCRKIKSVKPACILLRDTDIMIWEEIL